jgi:hypothetical protein
MNKGSGMLRQFNIALVIGLLLGAANARAQQLYIYPAHGQSAEQQQQDEFQCYQFGKSETGFDPAAAQSTQQPQQQKHTFAHGLLGGALLGTAIGAITGNTGEGAEIGAAAGGLFGGMKSQQQQQQLQQSQAQQQQAYQNGLNNYNRAYSACLEGRGYTVD